MPRYKLLIEYEGTCYSGWQRQPNAPTVEEEIEGALSQILQESVDVIGQGRTDSGVHAEGQVAHFDSSQKIDKRKLLYALLGVLPRDIAVWDLQPVRNDFHARFDAIARQYRYQFVTRASPLWYRTALLVADEIDWDVMQQCAKQIEGMHDFRYFAKLKEDQTEALCEVQHSGFERRHQTIRYRICANRFVHHMVRRLVGSMLQAGRGNITIDDFASLLDHNTTGKKAHGVAAKGLILEHVRY